MNISDKCSYPMHQILIFGKTSAVFDHLSSWTHWGLVTHICVSKQTIIGADNGLSPGRRQAIIWTIAGIMLIGLLGTNFSEILIEIYTFSFKKMHLKMSTGEWWPSCLGLNALNAMQSNVIKFSNEGGSTLIDPSHKSHNASHKYPIMHHFVTEMCTFLLQNVALGDMAQMHSGICEMGLLLEPCSWWDIRPNRIRNLVRP